MAQDMAANVRPEDYGTDQGHDFRVVEVKGNEVKIKYLSDGETAWFQKNRFERIKTDLRLV